ncbi:unnamed protein product [Rotaria sp. Silwood2]|nr:unnamed protein product [Rotaria sp. Silwood2]CAF4527025.1 unnamed protein product [Rotaria sp. Silwood2]CAF4600471.1 unnamed protein product [Rotaria sp. Silwood2]CAF4678362.1 unnamed protein product [Rotaria sp. Silwood2]
MTIIYHYVLFTLFFALLIHSYIIHPPLLVNDELMDILESNKDVNNRQPDLYYSTLRSYDVLKFIEELINSYESGKTSNRYFHSNLNLPRYLRHTN